MDKRAVIVCLGLGLAACQPALKPDTGYPAGWPAMTVLAPGFAELAGTFANEGTATTATCWPAGMNADTPVSTGGSSVSPRLR